MMIVIVGIAGIAGIVGVGRRRSTSRPTLPADALLLAVLTFPLGGEDIAGGRGGGDNTTLLYRILHSTVAWRDKGESLAGT